nr:Uncharacterised protein [Salmonella sp. NCTC 7297]
MIIFYHQKIDAGISGINLILNPAIKSVKFFAIKTHLIRGAVVNTGYSTAKAEMENVSRTAATIANFMIIPLVSVLPSNHIAIMDSAAYRSRIWS